MIYTSDYKLPEPITRLEKYWAYIAENGGGGGGGSAVLINKSITENGTYNASDDSADGYSIVTVNVDAPSPSLGIKTIISNGTYDASDDDYDGYSRVTVNVSEEIDIYCGRTVPDNTTGSDGDIYIQYIG